MIRDIFLCFIKVHILYHASKEPVYGLWLIEELAHHRYSLSPGTLCPTLHRLEKEDLLRSYRKKWAAESENTIGRLPGGSGFCQRHGKR